MWWLRWVITGGIQGLCVLIFLAGCGGTAATPTVAPTATATPAPTATPTSAPGPGGALGSPILPRPDGSPLLPRPEGTPMIPRPEGSPALPGPGGGPPSGAGATATLSAGAVDAASDGSCPDSHAIKATRVGKTYHTSNNPSYARVRAEECFATESDAQAAGYRRVGR